jgi:hypothetical protein
VRVFTSALSFGELLPVDGRIGPRKDPRQAGLNYLLLLSACLLSVFTRAREKGMKKTTAIGKLATSLVMIA